MIFKKVVVGISGGVDSAVSALLLKNKGYDVTGVFMRNWDIPDEIGRCSADRDAEDAEKICSKLGINLIHVNFVKEYWNNVFSNLITDYQLGLTPNPDILCNRFVKFNHFYRYAIEKLDADAIATGHYACSSFGCYLENYLENKKVKLLMSKDKHKDQTFFLSQIPQHALRRTMFPIGNLVKSSVRQIAIEHDLNIVSNKPDSVGICFIGERNFSNFISEYIEDKPGLFVDVSDGKNVGTHKGFHHWTLGQGAKLSGFKHKYFIARKEPSSNIIYLALTTNHPILYTQLIFTSQPYWINEEPESLKKNSILNCKFRFQHTKPLIQCKVMKNEKGHLLINLDKPMRAVTAGQYAVLYLDYECLGSTRIIHPGPSLFLLNGIA